MDEREVANDGGLTGLVNTPYVAHFDEALQVCICERGAVSQQETGSFRTEALRGVSCGCVSAVGQPSGIRRYDASSCVRECAGTSSSWVALEPGYCVQAPNAATSDFRDRLGFTRYGETRRFGSRYACEQSFSQAKRWQSSSASWQ